MLGRAKDDRPLEPVEFIVSHRLNTFASGVARFNDILAEHLGVRVVGLFDERLRLTGTPLLSFKVTELSDVGRGHLAQILARSSWRMRVFLHDWAGPRSRSKSFAMQMSSTAATTTFTIRCASLTPAGRSSGRPA